MAVYSGEYQSCIIPSVPQIRCCETGDCPPEAVTCTNHTESRIRGHSILYSVEDVISNT